MAAACLGWEELESASVNGECVAIMRLSLQCEAEYAK